MNHGNTKNKEFYENCTQYFEFLRKKSTVDYEFEDEYYLECKANLRNQIIIAQHKHEIDKLKEEIKDLKLEL